MARDFMVRVTDGERAAEWREVLGTDTLCVTGMAPQLADLPGRPASLVYFLDLEWITEEQWARLVAHLADRFGVAEEKVAEEMEEQGVPILAEGCVMIISNPQKYLYL